MDRPRCYNRKPFPTTVIVQDGWLPMYSVPDPQGLTRVATRMPRLVALPDKMSKGCHQWAPLGCARVGNWNCGSCQWLPDFVEINERTGQCVIPKIKA